MDIEKIRFLREKLRQLELAMGSLSRDEGDCCGITLSQCHTLIEIGKKEEIAIVELASRLGLDTSTLSRTINGLVLIGLVNRIENSKDRRYVSITLTEQGKKVYAEIENLNNGYFSKIFELIPEEKHEATLESVALFSDAVKKFIDMGQCCKEIAPS
jgi:DNA-binding MarR family transcriptional regulator